MRPGHVLLVQCIVVAVSLGAEAKRPLKPEDFAAIRDVDEPSLSPNGRNVVYVVGSVYLKSIAPVNTSTGG